MLDTERMIIDERYKYLRAMQKRYQNIFLTLLNPLIP